MKKTPRKKISGAAASTKGKDSDNIWTVKIQLLSGLYAERPWEAIAEVDPTTTLHELHRFILQTLGFDSDHLYEFYVAHTERSRDRISFADEDGESLDTALEEIFPLEKGRHLYYLYDFGDSWRFKITRHKTAASNTSKPKYPRLLSETGNKPIQYPSFDE